MTTKDLSSEDERIIGEIRRLIDDVAIDFDKRLDAVQEEHWKRFKAAPDDAFEWGSMDFKRTINDALMRILLSKPRRNRYLKAVWEYKDEDETAIECRE